MNAIYEGSRIINTYTRQPRFYGEGVKLYMVEMHTLADITRNQGITISELARMYHKTSSATTQIVNKLKKKGLVEKRRNKDYHKEINLFPTVAGKEICMHHNQLDSANYCSLLNKLDDVTEDEFQKFKNLFITIFNDLKENEHIE